MQTNNQKKLKNKIFIICMLFISFSVFFYLIILLLVNNKIQTKTYTKNQNNLISRTSYTQQEQETYNRILNKIEKEVDELTQQPEPTILKKQQPKLKYPPKIHYNRSGTTIQYIYEINQDTGKSNKVIHYQPDGKTIKYINEINQDTGKYKKSIHYQPDGKTIKYIDEFDQDTMCLIRKINFYDDGKTIKLITEYDKDKDLLIKEIYFNPDGTIKEIINY